MCLCVDAHDAAPALVRCRHVQIPFAVERQPLWPPQPAEKHTDLTALCNAVDPVKAGRCRPRHVQVAVRMKRQVVRGHRRSEEHTSELQSLTNIVCRLLLEKKKQ